jgi:hypothetical protein
MALALLLSGSAERDVLENRNVVFDDGGFADHDPSRVIEKDACPKLGGGMDVDLKRA